MSMIGKIILDIPPGENNPRNSEGAFLKLKNGNLIFIYSRFSGDIGGDDAAADIVALYSYDDGESFKDMKVLFTKEEHKAKNIMSVSAIRMSDGRIAVFYMVRMGFHDARAVIRISDDECESFSEPKYCINYPGYFVTNNDRVVMLSNGRIIVPAGFHRCLGPDPMIWESFNGKGVARFFYSDDFGSTFYESPDFGALNVRTKTGLQEPGIIETDSGKLLCFARTDLGAQYISCSYDYGLTWEPFIASDFTSPTSPLSIKKIPGTDSFIAVYNPVPLSESSHLYGWGRTPLVLRVSHDKCKTFGKPIIIENDPESGFCYIAMYFTDDSLMLAYCAGGPLDKGCLNRLRLRKIPFAQALTPALG